MRLYDFSVFAERRDALQREEAAAEAVVEVIAHIEQPGAVVELKQRVNGWFTLHQEVVKKAANLT